MIIRYRKLRENAIAPRYAHGSNEDACMDLFALGEVILQPNVPMLIQTGIALEIPSGYVGRILERSGLALKHGIRIGGGVIDPAYRGDVGVVATWCGWRANGMLMGDGGCAQFDGSRIPWASHGDSLARFRISPGDRIAQLCIQRYEKVELVEALELSDTVRAAAGFGSTGVAR
jgi:dUTP pyrophosphatase